MIAKGALSLFSPKHCRFLAIISVGSLDSDFSFGYYPDYIVVDVADFTVRRDCHRKNEFKRNQKGSQ